MRNFVKSAQDRVTLVLITAIQHHSIPDFRYQHGSVCQGCWYLGKGYGPDFSLGYVSKEHNGWLRRPPFSGRKKKFLGKVLNAYSNSQQIFKIPVRETCVWKWNLDLAVFLLNFDNYLSRGCIFSGWKLRQVIARALWSIWPGTEFVMRHGRLSVGKTTR